MVKAMVFDQQPNPSWLLGSNKIASVDTDTLHGF